MILVNNNRTIRSPGGLGVSVVDRTLQTLHGLVTKHQLHDGVRNYGNFSVEFDGQTTSIVSYEQRNGKNAVSFVDSGRFLQELQEGTSAKLPCMVKLVHVPGNFIASTSPLAVDIAPEEATVTSVLEQAGFIVEAHDVYKLPCYVYRYTSVSLSKIFGEEDIDGVFEVAKMFRSFGPGEMLLQAVQYDSENRSLLSVSETTGVRVQSDQDEVGALIDFLELTGTNELIGLMNVSNALQCVRYIELLNPSLDEVGIGLMVYYAMMDSAYLGAIPLDVIQAVGGAGPDGVFTINKVSGVAIPAIQGRFPGETLTALPILRSLDETVMKKLDKAKLLYKLLLGVRYLEFHGYPADPRVTLKTADRLSFFNLLV